MHKSPSEHVIYLRNTAKELGDEVSFLASYLLDDGKFRQWSGSCHSFAHHYGSGGLIEHTREVVELSLANNKLLCYGLDEKEIFLAALFHDCGKVWDYRKVKANDNPRDGGVSDDWEGTEHKRLIHHISRSGIEWMKAVSGSPLEKEYADKVLHAILAHHGQREFGSPVAPKTKVAWLIHLCDGISARMNDADTLDVLKRDKQ